MPIPVFNVINGGSHAGNKLAMQEFMLFPFGAESFSQAMRMGSETYHHLKVREQLTSIKLLFIRLLPRRSSARMPLTSVTRVDSLQTSWSTLMLLTLSSRPSRRPATLAESALPWTSPLLNSGRMTWRSTILVRFRHFVAQHFSPRTWHVFENINFRLQKWWRRRCQRPVSLSHSNPVGRSLLLVCWEVPNRFYRRLVHR